MFLCADGNGEITQANSALRWWRSCRDTRWRARNACTEPAENILQKARPWVGVPGCITALRKGGKPPRPRTWAECGRVRGGAHCGGAKTLSFQDKKKTIRLHARLLE